jgi:hypothetical protein
VSGRLKSLASEKSNLTLSLDKTKIELAESKRHSASLEQVGLKVVAATLVYWEIEFTCSLRSYLEVQYCYD